MTEITLREIAAGSRSDAASIWNLLERDVGNGGLTSSWMWTSTWLEVFGDHVPHLFLVAERDGAPCAITLITQGVGQKRGPVPTRTIYLGTAGEPPGSSICAEYERLLVREADRYDVSVAILRHIMASGNTWEEFVLDGFVPGDAKAFLQQTGYWFMRNEICRTSDLAAIRAAGGDLIESLGKNTRYSIRRSMRRFGDLTIEWASTGAEANEMFEEMVAIHQHHWQALGEPGAFADARFTRFHQLLIGRLLERDVLMMTRIRSSDQTIGCIYGFIEQNRVLMYQSGFADFDDDKLKPGLVSHAMVMQHCLERGIDEYDFLYGDTRYKQDLSNTT
ncbi:MAG: GNAT family N-acetyltransferase, partial [Thermomicrobiales bacterium]